MFRHMEEPSRPSSGRAGSTERLLGLVEPGGQPVHFGLSLPCLRRTAQSVFLLGRSRAQLVHLLLRILDPLLARLLVLALLLPRGTWRGLLGATAGPPNPECSASWTSLPRSTSLSPRPRLRPRPSTFRASAPASPPMPAARRIGGYAPRSRSASITSRCRRSAAWSSTGSPPPRSTGLSLAQSLACRHERTHLHGLSAGQLVHGPGRKRRLRERLHLGGHLPLAGLPQLAGEVVSAPVNSSSGKSVKRARVVVG